MSTRNSRIRFEPDDLPTIIEYDPDKDDSRRRIYLLRSTRAGKLLLTRPEFVPRDDLDRDNK